MFVVRDVFQCRPGQAKALAEILKRALPHFESLDGFVNGRVMVDAAGYMDLVTGGHREIYRLV